MKILWVKTDFLHPTTTGGQIRTLEILRRLHRRHEVHYVAFDSPDQPEGVERSSEYCSRAYPVGHHVTDKSSLAFAGQLLAGLFSEIPVAVSRYRPEAMEKLIESLLAREKFDRLVCDFLVPSVNIPAIESAVLFQHNVETAIWRRHAEHARDPARRHYFRLQASRMRRYEGRICREAAHVIAVSSIDASLMRELFGITRLTVVPTGVDVEFFSPPKRVPRTADLIFVGSMDWLPNIDGVRYFVREILPLIRRRRPGCSLTIVGRAPSGEIARLAGQDPRIRVTGTVDDVRPYLWGSSVSVVPIRIGGGTRLEPREDEHRCGPGHGRRWPRRDGNGFRHGRRAEPFRQRTPGAGLAAGSGLAGVDLWSRAAVSGMGSNAAYRTPCGLGSPGGSTPACSFRSARLCLR